jgi:DNA-binding LacI/PurR family transcriptional regulator
VNEDARTDIDLRSWVGTKAAELLLERLDGAAPDWPRGIVFPSLLFIRRSTAPPRLD